MNDLVHSADQPASFAFTAANQAQAKKIVARYPKGRQASAILPLLDLAQRQVGGWLPRAAIEHVATLLDIPFIRAYEVATFYTMFNLKPVGKYLLQLCGTTPCWLRGSDALKEAIREECGIGVGGTSDDGLFTLVEVECLGACVNAPMVQINDDYYEDLDKDSMKAILKSLREGNKPKTGPQNGRKSSEPLGGALTLTAIDATRPPPRKSAEPPKAQPPKAEPPNPVPGAKKTD